MPIIIDDHAIRGGVNSGSHIGTLMCYCAAHL
jgi:hypothetical protein